MKTIKCNKCYTELTIIEYDCGLFIEPCENCIKNIDIDSIKDDAYIQGCNETANEIKNNLIELKSNLDDSSELLRFLLNGLRDDE